LKITTKHLNSTKKQKYHNYDAIMEMCLLIPYQYFLLALYSFYRISSQIATRQTDSTQTGKQIERMTVLVPHNVNSTTNNHRHFSLQSRSPVCDSLALPSHIPFCVHLLGSEHPMYVRPRLHHIVLPSSLSSQCQQTRQ
jgi:hypothetical protein